MDSKVSELPLLPNPNGNDRLLIIDYNPTGTSYAKQMTYDTFLGSLPSNTNIAGNVSVSGNNTIVKSLTANNITLKVKYTPSSSADPVPGVGRMFYDTNYLYIKVANGVIKRLSLTSF